MIFLLVVFFKLKQFAVVLVVGAILILAGGKADQFIELRRFSIFYFARGFVYGSGKLAFNGFMQLLRSLGVEKIHRRKNILVRLKLHP